MWIHDEATAAAYVKAWRTDSVREDGRPSSAERQARMVREAAESARSGAQYHSNRGNEVEAADLAAAATVLEARLAELVEVVAWRDATLARLAERSKRIPAERIGAAAKPLRDKTPLQFPGREVTAEMKAAFAAERAELVAVQALGKECLYAVEEEAVQLCQDRVDRYFASLCEKSYAK